MWCFRVLVVAFAMLIGITLPGCRSRVSRKPVMMPTPVAFNDASAVPNPPSRELRLSSEGYRPVNLGTNPPKQPEITPRLVIRLSPMKQVSEPRVLTVPDSWREIAKSFTTGSVPESDTVIRARFIRALHDTDGRIVGAELFESSSHRAPFRTVMTTESPMAEFILDTIGNAKNADVEWDAAGRPEKFILHSE